MACNEFVCLSYLHSDLLIQKKYIQGSFSKEASKNVTESINLDLITSSLFKEPSIEHVSFTLLIANHFFITSAVANVIVLESSQFMLIPGIIGSFLHAKGISAFRFLNNGRIQYLLNIEALISETLGKEK